MSSTKPVWAYFEAKPSVVRDVFPSKLHNVASTNGCIENRIECELRCAQKAVAPQGPATTRSHFPRMAQVASLARMRESHSTPADANTKFRLNGG
jgi:hypothetical protein